MKRLIVLEWTKFRKNTVMQLLMLFFFLFLPACMYFVSLLPDIDLPSFLPNKKTFFQFPSVWEYLGYAGNWIVFFFIGVIAIYLVTIEVSNKTMRQSIINGMTRNEFFASKLLSIVVFSLVATLYYSLLSTIIGFFNTEDATLAMAFDNDWAMGRFFLMSFSYTVFAMFLAYLFRKAGLAVFFYVSYIMIIEPLLRLYLIEKFTKASWTRYFPMNSVEDLMPMPAFKYANAIPNEIDFAFLLDFKQATVLSLIYCALFLGISYYMFIKRDI